MPFLLLALFILVPIVELYVIIQIGGAIGIIPTLALLVADSILGTILLRSQGRAGWVAFNRALAESRMPAKEIFDGVLIIFGGALLLTPGFLTDIVGLILLIPPTRAIVRTFLRRFVVGRFVVAPAASWTYGRVSQAGSRPPGGPPPAGRRPGGPRPGDIEGSAEEISDGDSLPPGERSAFRG